MTPRNRIFLTFIILLSVVVGTETFPANLSCQKSICLEEAFQHLGLELSEIKADISGRGPSQTKYSGSALAAENLHDVLSKFNELKKNLNAIQSTENVLELLTFLSGPDFIPPQEPIVLPVIRNIVDSLDKKIPGAGKPFCDLLESGRLVKNAFFRLNPAEIEELQMYVREFPFWEDQWPGFPIERMVTLAGRIELDFFNVAAVKAGRAASQFRELLLAGSVKNETGPNEYILDLETPWGAVIIGGSGQNVYQRKCLLILDPGGNDTYEIGSSDWPSVSMIVDGAGDDMYRADNGYAIGGALFGLSWVEDCSGDDCYQGGTFSVGAAAMGAGAVIDCQGNDSYISGSLSQGGSFYGVGMLADFQGNDSYSISFGGQGACFAQGSAILIDLAGNDKYTAGGYYPEWRESGATKSFAQGVAAGLRPFARGGTALLYDRSGSDSCTIDYFGQGAGYWGGCGILVNQDGDDYYQAKRYAQGCGLHFSTGYFSDGSGNDSYTLGGVGQGAGEDRAYGLLVESAGDDNYNSGWMARGVGGTGGVGLMLELGGDDKYEKAVKVTDGYGSRTWELSGLGFLFDWQGTDNYEDAGRENSVSRNGTWGSQIDFPVKK